MRIPYINPTRKSIQFTQYFRGYYHKLKKAGGDGGKEDESVFYDMKNMSMKYSPIISTRPGRKTFPLEPTVTDGTNYVSAYPTGDKIIIANGTSLLFGSFDDGFETISSGIENSRKQFAAIGAKVLMIPDGIVFNTHDKTMEKVTKGAESTSYPLTIMPCILGSEGRYDEVTYVSQEEAPDDHSVYWYDTKNKALKRYSTVSYAWVGVGTAFLMVKADPADTALCELLSQTRAFDTLSFTTLLCSDSEKQKELDLIAKNSSPEGKGDNVIYETGASHVVISGFVFDTITVNQYKIERRIPKLDFITSLNNRIWGCSSEDHEIYSCKLGDPLQWYNYPGLASDSYAATIGSFGDFTGATSLNSYALFFKENSMFKIYGDYPANFQVVEIVCEGIQRGSERSVQELGGALYYKGVNGIMVYDGSIPQPFTDVFGSVKYKDAVAGTAQDKYYISMTDGNEYSLFVFDMVTGTWVKEDDLQVSAMHKYRNQLIVVDSNEKLIMFPEEADTDEGQEIEWMLETGVLGLANPDQKYISRIQLRIDLVGSLKIYIAYDNGDFQEVYSRQTENLRSYTVPINVKRCDHYRLKLAGVGHIKLYSYGYTVETGSDKQC